MGDLFGGPFFMPLPRLPAGVLWGSHDGAYDSGGSPFGGWRCHLSLQFGGAAKGKRL